MMRVAFVKEITALVQIYVEFLMVIIAHVLMSVVFQTETIVLVLIVMV